jgi:hypothetical protein
MTLPTKYQELVRQQVKQSGALDFDRDVILWHYANGAVGNSRNMNHISTQVPCVNDNAECRFWVTIALAIPMTLQFPC